MKALIVYSSQSGNTRKLAQSIYESLSMEKNMLPIEEALKPGEDEVLFLGFWLQGGKPDPKTAEYLAKVGKARLFLFATHGAAGNSKHAQDALAHAKSLAPSASFIGQFSCQGEVNPKVLEKVSKKSPPPPWIQDADGAVGHPDAQDESDLRAAIEALPLD